MAVKVLAQSAPAAATPTNLYASRVNSRADVSSISICNRSATQDSIRISLSLLNSTTANKDYLYYDLEIAGNDTFAVDLGWVVEPNAVLRIYSTNGSSSFTLFGQEVYPV